MRKDQKIFEALEDWWDPKGSMGMLHGMTPIRLDYIVQQSLRHFHAHQTPVILREKKVLDVGCGGGLLCEPLARMGANVTGIDHSERAISIARRHAKNSDLDITFHHGTLSVLPPKERYDVICCMELLEHLDDVETFLQALTHHLKSTGIVFLSTINKTLPSFFVVVGLAEYILRILPRGTHRWRAFVRPTTLIQKTSDVGLWIRDISGLHYHPVRKTWTLTGKTPMNYIACATRGTLNSRPHLSSRE